MSHQIDQSSLPEDDRTLLSRRSVMRTAAWSVPAVSLAASAPAFAASSATDALRLDTGAGYLFDDAGEPTSVGVRASLTAETVSGTPTGESSPPVVLVMAFADVWDGSEVTFSLQGPPQEARMATAEWTILSDGVTVNEDGSVTSASGSVSVQHHGGLVAGEGGFAEVQLVCTSTSAFTVEPANPTFGVQVLNPDKSWTALPGTSVSTRVGSGSAS